MASNPKKPKRGGGGARPDADKPAAPKSADAPAPAQAQQPSAAPAAATPAPRSEPAPAPHPDREDRPDLPEWANVHLWHIRFVRDLIWITLAVFIVWFGYELRAVFTPVLIALVLAYLFHPLITWMERKHRWPRPATISAILVVIGVVVLAFSLWLGPKLVQQSRQLAQRVPDYVEYLVDRYAELSAANNGDMSEIVEDVVDGELPPDTGGDEADPDAAPESKSESEPEPQPDDTAGDAPDTAAPDSDPNTDSADADAPASESDSEDTPDNADDPKIPANDSLRVAAERFAHEFQQDPMGYLARGVRFVIAGTGGAIVAITHIASTVTYVLLTLLLIPIYFFFFAWSFGPMVESTRKWIPQSKKDEVYAVIHKMDEAVGNYFRDRVIISLIMAAMFAVGWAIFGVPYYLLLAIVTGVLSLIPYAAVVGWVAALVLKLLELVSTGAEVTTWDWVWGLGGLTLVYGLVQLIEGWLLTPWIQGKSLNMSSVTILIVVFIGGAVGGMYGLILCIPIAACVKILLTDVFLPRFEAWCARN